MKMRLHIVFLFTLLGLVAIGQVPSAFLLRKTMQIGEQTKLIYELKGIKKGQSLTFYEKSDAISCVSKKENLTSGISDARSLEIIGKFHDTVVFENGDYTWRGSYTITAWDTGNYFIPKSTIATIDDIIVFPSVRLSVTSPKIEKKKGLYDIKEEFVSLPSKFEIFVKNYGIWLLVALIILLGVIYGWRKYKKRKKISPSEPLVKISLKQKTINELEDLLHKGIWEKEGIKAHYVCLSNIVRSYLGERYQLSLMDKTTYQIQALLVKSNVHKELLDELAVILEQSDLVKFAKSEPGYLEVMNSLQKAKEIVEKTSPYNE
jgi:hypothetical protein